MLKSSSYLVHGFTCATSKIPRSFGQILLARADLHPLTARHLRLRDDELARVLGSFGFVEHEAGDCGPGGAVREEAAAGG